MLKHRHFQFLAPFAGCECILSAAAFISEVIAGDGLEEAFLLLLHNFVNLFLPALPRLPPHELKGTDYDEHLQS
jgi:hypothetical protein